MPDDYLEMPLYLDDLPDDTTITLIVVTTDAHEHPLHNVTFALRNEGWWHISHSSGNAKATTLIEEKRISHFRILELRTT